MAKFYDFKESKPVSVRGDKYKKMWGVMDRRGSFVVVKNVYNGEVKLVNVKFLEAA